MVTERNQRPQPGDIGFCQGTGFVASMIRIGDWLRFRRSLATHVFIVVEPVDGRPRIVEAGGSGVAYAWLSDVSVHHELVPADAFPGVLVSPDPNTIVAQAHKIVGAKYGFMTIASIVVNLLTPKWIRFPDFRRGTTFICSAAAAWCLHAGGADIETYDIYQIFPTELYEMATPLGD